MSLLSLPFSLRRLTGIISILFALPCFAAEPDHGITLSTASPKQGETIQVFVKRTLSHLNDESEPPPVFEIFGRSVKAFPVENYEQLGSGYRALIAVPADVAPGTYTLKTGETSRKIAVKSAQFPLQRIRLPKGKDNFDASPGEKEAVDKAKATLTAVRSWKRHFDKPTLARISTVFGVKRVVNGKLLPDYFHSGLDFAAPLGSLVHTCAPGKVVLIGKNWKLHGNVVAIDHGQGVVSFYIHLQKILVADGQPVKSGEFIGKVGQSGRASGPHLHFSIYVNAVATDPKAWFRQVY